MAKNRLFFFSLPLYAIVPMELILLIVRDNRFAVLWLFSLHITCGQHNPIHIYSREANAFIHCIVYTVHSLNKHFIAETMIKMTFWPLVHLYVYHSRFAPITINNFVIAPPQAIFFIIIISIDCCAKWLLAKATIHPQQLFEALNVFQIFHHKN